MEWWINGLLDGWSLQQSIHPTIHLYNNPPVAPLLRWKRSEPGISGLRHLRGNLPERDQGALDALRPGIAAIQTNEIAEMPLG